MQVKIQRSVPSSPKLLQARESFQLLPEGNSKSQLHRYQPSEGKKNQHEKEQKSILPTKIVTELNLQISKVVTKMKKTFQLSPSRIQINCLITWAKLTLTQRRNCNFWLSKNKELKWLLVRSNLQLIRLEAQEPTVYKAFKESKSWPKINQKHSKQITLLHKWKNFKNALSSQPLTRNQWKWRNQGPIVILFTSNLLRKKRKKNN